MGASMGARILRLPAGRAASEEIGYAYVHSLPDLKEVGRVFVGQHPEWLTFTPDGRYVYVAAAGDNAVFVVDAVTMKEVARIPVGQVPKRNATAILQVSAVGRPVASARTARRRSAGSSRRTRSIGARTYIVVKASVAFRVSHCIVRTPPLPPAPLSRAIVNCSTGAGSVSTFMSTRPRSWPCWYSVPHWPTCLLTTSFQVLSSTTE